MRRMLVALALAACGSSEKRSEGPPPFAPATEALWSLAPPTAVLGLVVGDGVLERLIEGGAHWAEIAAQHPASKQLVDGLRQTVKAQIGLEPFDARSWRSLGLDPSRGLAIFAAGDPSAPAVLILPVSDRVALRRAVGAETRSEGGVELDLWAGLSCAMMAQRYVCSHDLAAVRATAPHPDAPLAQAARALPAPLRGDAEALALRADTPAMLKVRGAVAPFLDGGAKSAAALRFGPEGATVRAWIEGKPNATGRRMIAGRTPPALVGDAARAAGVTRVHLDAALLREVLAGRMPAGPVAEAFLAAIGGDAVAVSRGKTLVGGVVAVSLTDAPRARRAVADLCGMARGQPMVASADLVEGACTLKSGPLPGSLPPLALRVAVDGERLVLDLGGGPPEKGALLDDAGSPEAREILGSPQSFAVWARAHDYTSLVPLARGVLGDSPIVDALEPASWIGLHLYEVGGALAVREDGVHLLLRATTFAADPPAARDAYAQALGSWLARDASGWMTDLASIEKAWPGTLAGRQAALIRHGHPALGMPGIAIAFALAGMR